MDFSLMFFSCADVRDQEKYQLMIKASMFADTNGFSAIWMPERHFHSFGGLYPNPAITSAALATITNRIHLRAGSLVSPIHDIVRVAEEWSVVDNISMGRVGLSFASGWHHNDFIFYPENYQIRHQVMDEQIQIFNSIWKGEKVSRKNGKGENIDIELWPKPYKNKIPLWISVSSDPNGFYKAGSLGYGVLTHLVNQDLLTLRDNIKLYNDALKANNFEPRVGRVTLMLHTYIHDDVNYLYDNLEVPFKDYLKNIVKFGGIKAKNKENQTLNDHELQNQLVDISYKRYIETASLIGTSDKCKSIINNLKDIGVTEMAALVDFGINSEKILESLVLLNNIRKQL